MYNKLPLLDCHVHYSLPVKPEVLMAILKKTGTDVANLVLVPDRRKVSSVPDGLMIKHMYQDKLYVFGSLDVTQYFMHNKNVGKHFSKYVDRILKAGCDGIKMIEGKPDLRKTIPIPDFDSASWAPFWKHAEEIKLPILWHVNDPEEFWDEKQIPSWAKERGWFYGDEFIKSDDQYNQVFNVLKKHPNLKIIFAHFFFMSNKLEQLSKLLDTYPNIMIDLTPGIEMYQNFSKNYKLSKAFFIKYQDRIIYGTDIGARWVLQKKYANDNRLKESQQRSDMVTTFIAEEKAFTVMSDGNFLIGTDDVNLKGLGLKSEIQKKIFSKNFLAFVDSNIKEVNVKLAIKECNRNKLLIRIMSFIDKKLDPDYESVKQVKAYFKNVKNQGGNNEKN